MHCCWHSRYLGIRLNLMATSLQVRRGTAAQWISVNPVLKIGEPGLETDTHKIKYGDGATQWISLDYSTGAAGPAGADGADGINGADGADGAQGIQGIQGPPGSSISTQSQTFSFPVATDTWTFTHSMPYQPTVTLTDDTNREFEAEITYNPSLPIITVGPMNSAVAGKAVCT